MGQQEARIDRESSGFNTRNEVFIDEDLQGELVLVESKKDIIEVAVT